MENAALFVDRVEERRVGPCRLLLLKTPVRAVVSWQGSFASHPDFGAEEELVQRMTTELLDKGTRSRDRFALAEVLENRGAHLSFSSAGPYVEFRGQALREDVADVIAVMAEQLREPLFDAAEFEKARARLLAGYQRAMDDTGIQASSALWRQIYDPAHPNYSPPTPEALRQITAMPLDAVERYHDRHFGANQLLLVFVGDVDADAIAEAVRAHFGGWPPREAAPTMVRTVTTRPPVREEIPMPDKANVDVRLGHGLSLLRQDDAYVPLYLANHILGGNFSARLMAEVRDVRGLTYGIRSSLSGVTTEYQGHWQINVTLSQDNLDAGEEATRGVVEQFVAEGPTEAELADHKATVAGGFQVGLATTEGLAATLHLNARRGFETAYLDRYVEEIHAVKLDEVREAISDHFRPDALHQIRAGVPL